MAKKNQNNLTNTFINSWTRFFNAMGVKKEDIIIDDIYNLSGGTSQTITGNMSNLDSDVAKVTQKIDNVYSKYITEKEDMLEQSRELFETDVVQTIIDVILDEGFNSFKEDEDFQITYELSPEELDKLGQEFVDDVQKAIDDFVEKSSLKSIVADLVPELLRDGEHALKLRLNENKGITGINDDLDVINMLPFYRGNKLAFIVEKTEENSGFMKQEKLRVYNPENIVFFRLKYFTKKALKTTELFSLDKDVLKAFEDKTHLKIPKFVRVCKPFYYSALDTISVLRTLEDMGVAQDFADLTRKDVLTVNVPKNTTAEDAKKIVREYERHLNEGKVFIDSYRSMTIDALVEASKERKLLPTWSDGKGTVNSVDLSSGNNKSDNLRTTSQYLRGQVGLSTGVPGYFLTNSESPADKTTLLKLHSRFTNKLTSVQKCLEDGVVEIIHKHLSLININVEKSNIKSKFRPLTNGDILDEIDIMVTAVTGMSDFYDAIEKIAKSSSNELVINNVALKEFWDTYTSSFLGTKGILVKDENKFSDMEGDEEDFEDTFERPSRSSRSRENRTTDVESPNEAPETGELTQGQEQAIDNANAEAKSDFVNSTTAEL